MKDNAKNQLFLYPWPNVIILRFRKLANKYFLVVYSSLVVVICGLLSICANDYHGSTHNMIKEALDDIFDSLTQWVAKLE